MSFYAKCMRYGSLILFWIAVVTAIATFVSAVGGIWDMLTSGVSNPYQSHSPNAFLQLLLAIGTALSSAAWPFFGAALLWLLDSRLVKGEVAE